MALANIARLPRNLQRLGEIIAVFARHGFGHFISRLNLQEHIPFARRLFARRAAVTDKAPTTEQRLVNALQELGTTFIKLGQTLSSRPDIVGPSFAEAFKQLQDRVEPFDPAAARQIVEDELRMPVSEVFRSFEQQPSGCGSIAQVHRAVLKDGTNVMVKIRRPGIEASIFADMAILRLVARLAEARLPELRPSQIIDEFGRAIRDELDFTVEASNTARFHDMLREADGTCAPAVFWELTTSAVLTIQRLEGVSIGDVEELEQRGHDRIQLAKTLTECFVNQYFREDTFHADPHPGNFLVLDDGKIGIIDFGMVGHLSSETQGHLTAMLGAGVSEEIQFAAETGAELGAAGEQFEQKQFTRDVTDLFHRYRGMPLGRIDTRRVFSDLTRVARQNDLSLPRDLVLLGKSMAELSAVTRTLAPSYDIIQVLAPSTKELMKEKLWPGRWAKHAGVNALGVLQMLRDLPRDLRSIIRKAESGRLQVSFRHTGLERTVSELDRASNRLSISIYVAAVLVASSLMIQAEFLPFRGVSVPGALGYALAGVLSAWLAWGILRSGRL